MKSLRITVPSEFSFELSLVFLKRSPKELLHIIDRERVIKALRVDNELVVFHIFSRKDKLIVDFLTDDPSAKAQQYVRDYITEWFDLETDLKPFYKMASEDKLLKDLVLKYSGYRIMGQPDLFESLVWAVLGQQINVSFAYTLKQKFVEQFGESVVINNQPYYLFPLAARVARLTPDQLLALQFSRQKAAYVITIAQAFADGTISKEKLKGLPLKDAKEELIKIKGIGNWTANYALMKTFRYPDAFPLEDAGIHNAIKNHLKLKAKPSLEQVKKIFKKYKGWEAYATLYLWRSL